MHRLREHHRANPAASSRSNSPAWDTTPRPSADTVILGWHAVFFTRKCLHLGADRTFDKPYPPRPKAFLHVNDQGWPITGESPRLVSLAQKWGRSQGRCLNQYCARRL
jgi:hypothetical protein